MSSIDDLLDMFEIDYFLQQNEMQLGPTINQEVAENWHRRLYDRLQSGKRTFPCAALLSFKEEFGVWKMTKKEGNVSEEIAKMRLKHLKREQETRRALEPFVDEVEQKKQALDLIFSGLAKKGQDPNQLLNIFKAKAMSLALSKAPEQTEPQEKPLDLVKSKSTSKLQSEAPILAKSLARTTSLPRAPPPPTLSASPISKMSQLQLQLQAQPFANFQSPNYGPFPISQHLNAYGPLTGVGGGGGGHGAPRGQGQGQRKRKRRAEPPAPTPPPISAQQMQMNLFHSTQMLLMLQNRHVDPWIYQNWERLTLLQKQLLFQIGTGQMVPRNLAPAPAQAPPTFSVAGTPPKPSSTASTNNFHSIIELAGQKEQESVPSQNATSSPPEKKRKSTDAGIPVFTLT